MKIIVLGDVHGNLPALEVALREARAEGYDQLVHTGDLVGFAPFPEETVGLIRSRRIPGVRGNVDERIAAESPTLGFSEGSPATPFEERAYAWTLRRTERLTRNFLGNLPFERRMEIGVRRAVLLHATPIDAYTRLSATTDDDLFREMGEISDADIIIFGHTHRAFHRIVDGRHFINVGSVGYPGDDDPRTGYAVIRADISVEVRFERYPYDVKRLLRVAAERRFPVEAREIFRV